jgi:hypothetical protein
VVVYPSNKPDTFVGLAACLADAPRTRVPAPHGRVPEQELGRRCRLLRLWDAPPDRGDDFLRAHAGSVRAVVSSGGSGAGAKLIDALPGLEIIFRILFRRRRPR